MVFHYILIQEEEVLKRTVWEENVKRIKLHNMENSLGKNTFTMEINEFADMVSVTRIISHCFIDCFT